MNYEEKAKSMSISELYYALLDVIKTIEVQESDEWTRNHLESCPYLQRLYAEKDALITERMKRR